MLLLARECRLQGPQSARARWLCTPARVAGSFYRKLFLAFVAAVFVPVVALVLVTRNYVAAQMEASIEQEAIRTASAAGRVVEDLARPEPSSWD